MTTPAQSDAAATPRLPLVLKVLADWERANGTLAAIIEPEYEALCEALRKASVIQSPRQAEDAISAAVEEMRRELLRERHDACTLLVRAEQAEQSVTRLKQELGEARACIREVSRIITGEDYTRWQENHAAAIAQSGG